MSGVLASLSGALDGALPSAVLGLLRRASWRGIGFEMLDGNHEVSRRWQRFMFPGLPTTKHEDLGSLDGPIEVNALLIGDDYVHQVKRFAQACKAAGPGTLRHPWLGSMKVVLLSAHFGVSDSKLRVATATLRFEPWDEDAATSSPGTLSSLLDSLDGLLDAGQEMLADALSPLGDALGALGMAQSVLAAVGGAYTSLLGATSGTGDAGALAAAATGPLDAVTGGVALDPADVAGSAGTLLGDVPAALSGAATAGPDPAVGAGPAAVAPVTADPRAAATLLLAVAAPLQAPPGALPAQAALLQLARLQATTEAARAASAIPFTSRDEAVAWRDRIGQAWAILAAELALAAAARPLGAAAAWRAVQAASAAWGRDMLPVIGRLPPVRHLFTTATLSAWQVALAVAGDNPAAIRPALLDLVARNRILNPAVVPPGRLEVLVP